MVVTGCLCVCVSTTRSPLSFFYPKVHNFHQNWNSQPMYLQMPYVLVFSSPLLKLELCVSQIIQCYSIGLCGPVTLLYTRFIPMSSSLWLFSSLRLNFVNSMQKIFSDVFQALEVPFSSFHLQISL